MKVYVLESFRFGIAGGVLLRWAERSVKRSNC